MSDFSKINNISVKDTQARADISTIQTDLSSRLKVVVSDTEPEDTSVIWIKPSES